MSDSDSSNKDSDEESEDTIEVEKVEGSSSINKQQLLLGKANNNSSKTNQKVIKIINY